MHNALSEFYDTPRFSVVTQKNDFLTNLSESRLIQAGVEPKRLARLSLFSTVNRPTPKRNLLASCSWMKWSGGRSSLRIFSGAYPAYEPPDFRPRRTISLPLGGDASHLTVAAVIQAL
jgi:hypothetical protein